MFVKLTHKDGRKRIAKMKQAERCFYRGGEFHPGFMVDDDFTDHELCDNLTNLLLCEMYEGSQIAGDLDDWHWQVVPESIHPDLEHLWGIVHS